jgi:hypothetical protein
MVERIVSGGQTGVDRGALDAALALGIACGGWCPAGRRAEDGTVPAPYPLTETAEPDYAVRTRLNVRDSDATLILLTGPLEGGTALTRRLAAEAGRPCRVVDLDAPPPASELHAWLGGAAVRVLNVAGPRESQRPGIQERARAYLTAALGAAAEGPLP